MSLYGDALAAIRSIILIDERVQAQARKVERLAEEVEFLKERLIRLEAIIEVAMQSRGGIVRGGARRGRPAITDERS